MSFVSDIEGYVSKRDLRDFERPRRTRHGDTLHVRGKAYTVTDQVNSPLKRGLYSLAAAGGPGAKLSMPVRQSKANKHFFWGPSAVRNVESYDPAARAARLRVRRTSGAERAAERQGHMIAGGVGGGAAAGVAAGYVARKAPKRGLIIPATALAGAGLGVFAGSRVRPRSHTLEYAPPR